MKKEYKPNWYKKYKTPFPAYDTLSREIVLIDKIVYEKMDDIKHPLIQVGQYFFNPQKFRNLTKKEFKRLRIKK